MIQENLQINIGANTQDLQTGLNQATASVNTFSASVQRAVKPTGDATQSLTNLGRIAQDAPYGFIGIANNLNPMLESFQRLQKEAGGSGAALKAMAAGLSGPAGIGIALSVGSSLLLAFGKQIDEFYTKLQQGSTYSIQYADTLKGIGGEFTASVEKVNKVKIAFEQYHAGLLTGDQATKIYNDTLGKNLGFKNGVNEAETNFINKSAAYVEASFKRSAADSAGKKAAEELLKQRVLQETGGEKTGEFVKMITAEAGKAVLGPLAIKPLTDKLVNLYDEDKTKKDIAKAGTLYDTYLSIQRKFQNEAQDIINKNPGLFVDPTKVTAPTKTGVSNLKDEMSASSKELEAYIKEYNSIKHPYENREMNRKATIQEFELNKGDKTPNKLDKDLPMFAKEYIGEMNRFDEKLKASYKNAEDFAGVLSKDVAGGLMTMWDAMQQGENPLQALGNYLAKLVEELAAAVIQALLFQTIMSALGFGGVAAGGKGGGFLGGIGKLLGFAEGGIVSQPTIAMVGEGGQSEAIMPLNKLGNMMNSTFNAGAMSGTGGGGGNGQFVLKGNDLVLALQRSNYSLNLRRGA